MSQSALSTLLASIRVTPHLPAQSWYIVAAATFSSLNRPEQIPHVFEYALDKDSQGSQELQLQIARRMREALVKTAPIGGLPKSINALAALKKVTPPALQDEPLTYSPSQRPIELYDIPSSRIMNRGQNFFDKIYGKVSKRVMGQMDRSADDLGITARIMYGYILSNTRILSPAETSFVVLAGLIPQDVNPQLKGHLKGALNNGATVEEVRAVREVVVRLCEASGMTQLGEEAQGGWGWRGEVANL